MINEPIKCEGFLLATPKGVYRAKGWVGYEKITPDHFKVVCGEPVPTDYYGFTGFGTSIIQCNENVFKTGMPNSDNEIAAWYHNWHDWLKERQGAEEYH